MFPSEIFEVILRHVSDVESVSNCRKTCYLFNYLLTKNTKYLSNKIKTYIWNPFPKPKSINLDFMHSFPNLRSLDIPVNIEEFSDLDKFSNYTRLTLNLKIDMLAILEFIENFIMKGGVLKINYNETKYWVKMGTYGKEGGICDVHDILLMDICRCKTLISDVYSNYHVENTIFLCNPEEIKGINYVPPIYTKHYKWRPVQSKYRNLKNNSKEYFKNFKFSYGVRPNIKTYEMPLDISQTNKLKEVFINLENHAYIENDYFYTKNETINLNGNLPKVEEYMNTYF